ADQDDEGERHFADHEQTAQPNARVAARRRAAVAKARHDVLSLGEDGNDSEGDSGEGGDRESEQGDAPVEDDFFRSRGEASDVASERADHTRGAGQTDRTPGEREQNALGKQLPEQASSSGAESRPNGELALSPEMSGEREVGNVDAGDEQHQSRDGEKDEE